MASIRETLDNQLSRFEELERQMSDPDVLADGSKFSAVAREHGSMAKLATKYRRFKSLVTEVAELKRMADSGSPDEKELAEAELPDAVRKRARRAVDRAIGRHRRRRRRQPQPLRDGNPRWHRRR
jgi:peptide chain release factor 1